MRLQLPFFAAGAQLLLTLRGTPTMYYGDELGMRDVAIALEDVCDPQGLNLGDARFSRDPARPPMQWDAGPGEHAPCRGRLLPSTCGTGEGQAVEGRLELQGDEGILVELDG